MFDDSIRVDAVNWYEGALVDLEEAFDAFSHGRYNWALFAAHQAVEKALKVAYMILRREPPPRSHDLIRLVKGLNLRISKELLMGISELTPYYTISRYPNAGLERPWEDIDRGIAERLLSVARGVVELVGEETGLRRAKNT